MRDYEDIAVLIGKTLAAVIRNGDDSIDFEATTGESWRVYHSQDCCERVEIEDVVGDLEDLVDSPIVLAEESSNHAYPVDTQRTRS